MTPIAKHNCEMLPKVLNIEISRWYDTGWKLCIEEYDTDIIYCPYCGERLEE